MELRLLTHHQVLCKYFPNKNATKPAKYDITEKAKTYIGYISNGFEVIDHIINNSGGIIPRTTSDRKKRIKTNVVGKSKVIWSFKAERSRKLNRTL